VEDRQIMRVCVVRDRWLNPWDAGNYYGLSRDHDLILCGRNGDISWSNLRELYPNATVFEYEHIWQVLELDPDVIDTPDAHYEFTQQLTKRYDYTVISTWDNIPGKNTMNPAALEALGNAWKFIARSKWAKSALTFDGVDPDRIRIIPGAVDTKKFSPGIAERQDVVLHVGRLVMEKGLISLIWAIANVPGVELWVVGEGPEKSLFREWVEKAGITKRVKWLGSLNREELAEVYKQVKVFALPSIPVISNNPYGSWVEQFGQVLIEAMSSGVPIVGTKAGSIPEVGGSAGLYLPTMDWVKMAEHIDQLIFDKEKWAKLAHMARRRAELYYDQDVVGAKLARWYQEGR
jgi:glycosyltransferase involved in cell wall biosynthesis